MDSELKALEVLTNDLVKLQSDMKVDIPSITHSEFKEKYLPLFLGNIKATNHTFYHWYAFTGYRTCFVNVTDYVDGELKVVYQVPPLLNRNGITSIPTESNKSIHHLLGVAEIRSARLPRRQAEFFTTFIGQAQMTTIEPDTEADLAWVKLLEYNGIEMETAKTIGSTDETEELEHTSEEIPWDDDEW